MASLRKSVLVAAMLLGLTLGAEECSAQCRQSSLAFAYQYGYPLYALGLYAAKVKNSSTNTVYVTSNLSTPADTAVVRPNVDTLYATTYTDVSENDLVFTVPEIEDGRYWVLSFYDAYANNFANIASIYSHKAGDYLLRPTGNNFGLQSTDLEDGFAGYINTPTPYGVLLVRIVVNNLGEDLEYVKAVEGDIMVRKANTTRRSIAPPLDLGYIQEVVHNTSLSNAEAVLELTAAIAPYNLPEVLSDRPWVNTTLKQAGIVNGTFVQPKNTNLTAAAALANATAANFYQIAGSTQNLGNNWTQPSPNLIGDYGSFYNARQAIGIQGYLALTADIATYPRYGSRSSLTTAPEGSKQAFLLTFSGKPKLKPSGFWSLTVYNEALYLVPNDLDRWVINDRSNFTYPDGTPVYGDNERNDEFQILLQSADVPPPANWTSNWLPTPAGGKGWANNLRFYGAEDAMINGSYVYPVVTLIDAITE